MLIRHPYDPLLSLSYAILFNIFSFLHLQDLTLLAEYDPEMSLAVHSFVLERLEGLLAPFDLQLRSVLEMLHHSGSVISGSFALRALFPGDGLIGFEPDDVDFYVPLNGLDEALLYFMNFTDYMPTRIYPRNYSNKTMRQVLILQNGHRTINIIVSASEHAVYPVFHFHSTCVINFITSQGIFCAYPDLTFAFKNLINELNPLKWTSISNRKRLLFCLQKYRERGFSNSIDLSPWEEYDRHTCGEEFSCPLKVRYSWDKGCFYYPLFALGYRNPCAPIKVSWQLGGICRVNVGLLQGHVQFHE